MTKAIMIQGTASGAGKSLMVTGLCRIFRQDGFSVAPFKSQNMALNSFVTRDGLEMGRAQAAQAEAAGLEPSVLMNPILLKPTGDATSEVIVHGEAAAVMGAAEYHRRKAELLPAVVRAYQAIARRHDIVVLEGAGSPAEINLRDNDFVNMGMAAIARAPVLLVGDIDRGGVFASLYGTVGLLQPDEQARVRGFVVNKFRGDSTILEPGLRRLEELTAVPVLGVVPWLRVDLDDEDSLSPRLATRHRSGLLDAAVIRLPRIANFTDFNPLHRHPAFGVRYVETPDQLGRPDLLCLPGTKNTPDDLAWLRRNGLGDAIRELAREGVPVIGVAGGYHMLGALESGADAGLELLPVTTVFPERTVRRGVTGRAAAVPGFFSCLAGAEIAGYQLHSGVARPAADAVPFAVLDTDGAPEGAVAGNVLGTSVHGLFDSGEIVDRLAARLLADKGLPPPPGAAVDPRRHRERQYDLLADALREALDMRTVYGIIGLEPPG